jgi:hypothetical protein
MSAIDPVRPIIRSLGDSRRFKRTKDRRVFRVVDAHPVSAHLTLSTLRGTTTQVVSEEKLARDFIPVAKCPGCGWHHDTRKLVRAGCRRLV